MFALIINIILVKNTKKITMSVKVENIYKLYGKQQALKDVSFNIKAGEVVGLLGPNGAGKTTMMKILTCFIPQTSGKAVVCGYDVMENSLQVRKKVGYLPENNPLYMDMYVIEYLKFMANLHKIGNDLNKRVEEIIDITGLGPEQHKKLRALSKGYRQRAGLAQALIHDPDVLILDEPTSGLDPNQLIEIRNLIVNVGKQKTIILSTHIMQEVEAVCDRVIIINDGKIIADALTPELQIMNQAKKIISVEFDSEVQEDELKKIEGVKEVNKVKENVYRIFSVTEEDLRHKIFNFAVDKKLVILSIKLEEQSLEDIFRVLTSGQTTEVIE